MIWIIGGDTVAAEIGKRSGNSGVAAVAQQFSEHAAWAGFRFYDLIFPLFLFMIGVAIPFSIGGRVERGDPKQDIVWKVVRRSLLLIGLGILYNGALSAGGVDHTRVFGVLQRLGLCYFIASLVFIFTRARFQLALIATALLGYWAMLHWIQVPGVPRGDLSEWGNAANYLDRLMLRPGQMYEKYGDPEGLLSTIPAVGTALLGVIAGKWLKSSRPPERKAACLALAGLACLALGCAWAPFFPVIKKLWTSSYVLVAGGFSLELLALFYWVIDVRRIWKWSIPLMVVGMNALTIYMLASIVDFTGIASWFLAGVLRLAPAYNDLGLAVGALVCEWLLVYFLYRQRIFVRV